MTKRLEEENKKGVNDKSLIVPMLELDYLITPQNVSEKRIFKLLKQTGHSFFSDLEIANDGDLTFAVDCYIQIFKKKSLIYIRSFDRLNDHLHGQNDLLMQLLQEANDNYSFANFTIHSKPKDVCLHSEVGIMIKGGISETSFIETCKLFVATYFAMKALIVEEHLYDWSECDE
jgi:hypothetical protein